MKGLSGRLAWAVLFVPLAALLALAAVKPPSRTLMGDEPTYALQAASLAWDHDLVYDARDEQRFVQQWGERPGPLDLDSRDHGRTQVYRRPALWALLAAPFVRAMPLRGAPVLAVLLLALAAWLAARALAPRVGAAAPVWIAAFVFGSAAFAYVFRITADVFLLAAAVAGLALAFGAVPEEALPSMYEGERVWSWKTFGRWLAAGALLAVPGAYHPFYLLILPAAGVAARANIQRRRRSAAAGLLVGAVLLLGLTWLVHLRAGGEALWRPSAWSFEPDPKLLGWNLAYFLVGRHVGVLLYFLPLLAALAAYRPEGGRRALLLGVGLAVLGFLLIRPFNFFGGPGTIADRTFLPLYGALWLLPARPARPAWPLLAVLLAAPFLYPLWLQAPSPVSPVAERWLPFEITQRELPVQWLVQHGLRVGLIGHGVWAEERGTGLRIAGGGEGEILLASPEPIHAVDLALDPTAPTRLTANGQALRPSLLRADGWIFFEVPLGEPRAVHPMGWSRGDVYLYPLRLSLPGAPAAPVGFDVLPVRDLVIQRTRR